jgi:hypothetical protein
MAGFLFRLETEGARPLARRRWQAQCPTGRLATRSLSEARRSRDPRVRGVFGSAIIRIKERAYGWPSGASRRAPRPNSAEAR